MKITTLAVVIVMVILLASDLGAQSSCSDEYSPDRIRVRVIGECKPPDIWQLRIAGENPSVLVVAVNRSKGYWEGDGFDWMIKSVQLCSGQCIGYSSSCAYGAPVPDRNAKGEKICVAEYKLNCDEQGWTLNVSSNPPVMLSYTRRRPDAASVAQRGELKVAAAPGRICDLAIDEQVWLKPKVKATFRDIPVSRAQLEKEHDSWKLSDKLLEYIVLPGGRRANPGATEAETTWTELAIKELTLTVEKR